MYSKGGRGIISVSAQQGWERDSLCKCIASVGEGFFSVSVLQGWERDFLFKCITRVGRGFSLEV